jgi:hypothetical protein
LNPRQAREKSSGFQFLSIDDARQMIDPARDFHRIYRNCISPTSCRVFSRYCPCVRNARSAAEAALLRMPTICPAENLKLFKPFHAK